jgi:hypothetical protein
MSLIAFRKTEISKPVILKQLRVHAKADQLIKGQYWQDGKGCAVGCTVHCGDHSLYEPKFGIPQMLARLEDCIFEGLPNVKAKAWPIRFMDAIVPGTELVLVGWKFMHWILTDDKATPGILDPLVCEAVKGAAAIIAKLAAGETIDASAAWSAARSAESAAWSAAWSAESAAWSAARSAESAARSAESAARSAAESAYVRMSDKLIALIKVAPKAKRIKKAA